jgi:hypothetical protein
MPMWTPAVALGTESKAKPAITIRRTNNLFIQNLFEANMPQNDDIGKKPEYRHDQRVIYFLPDPTLTL